MAKILKIIAKSFGIIAEWILILLIILAFAIRTELFQTYLAQKATAYLSKELKADIKIGKMSIVFIDQLLLEDVSIVDPNKDTLGRIGRLYVTLDDYNLKTKVILLKKAELEDGTVHLFRDQKNGDFNFKFLSDYFKSDSKTPSSKPFKLGLKELQLSNVDFKYDDFRKENKPYGVDFNHLDLKGINLFATNFSLNNGDIKATLAQFSAREKSGLEVENLATIAHVNTTGIRLKDLKIKTPLTKIDAPIFQLLYGSYADFSEFVDKVNFVSYLKSSSVSMKDVSLFATTLQGMDAQIDLSGNVSEKIKNLKLRNFDIRTGKRTHIAGNFNLPDFRNIKQAFFSEKIAYAYIDLADLQKFKLPKSSSSRTIQLDERTNRLEFFEAKDLRLDGFYQEFVVSADVVNSALGKVKIDNGILFTVDPTTNLLAFERSEASTYDVKVENFDLGTFLADKTFGKVDGTFFLSGTATSVSDIRFNSIQGDVNRFDYLNYPYSNIQLMEGSLIDKVLLAKIDVKDDNLDLTYDGTIDLNGEIDMNFDVTLNHAFLNELNLTKADSTFLQSKFSVNLHGSDPNKMYGDVTMGKIVYKEGDKEIIVPEMKVNVQRGVAFDEFNVDSEIGELSLKGKIDFATIGQGFIEQFDKVFPGLIPIDPLAKKAIPSKKSSNFTYEFNARKMDDFLDIFAPELAISYGTKLHGAYDAEFENFTMFLTSTNISYTDFSFHGIDFQQMLVGSEITANYKLARFQYGDSIHVEDIHFTTKGENNMLHSELVWQPNTENDSKITWETAIADKQLNILLAPSYFSLNNLRWNIENQSDFAITDTDLHISKFKLSRGTQYLTLDGCLSKNDADKMNMKIANIDLHEVGTLLGLSLNFEGQLNGWGYLSNPFVNPTFMGDASINGLFINEEEVGDIFFQSEWNKLSESIKLMGDLKYRGNQTFEFMGNYFTAKEEDNFDLYLLFDKTDIAFANAFMDPDVITNIGGQLNGNLKVTGTPTHPKLNGKLNLKEGNTKVEMLGVNFGFDGDIIVDEYGFYINNMPILDEDNNSGTVIGSVYHDNFSSWNFDVSVNLAGNEKIYGNNYFSFASPDDLPERFLIMNTSYEEGGLYYGKAYATGDVNIFGYDDLMEISVNLKTRRGTSINFPMYGSADLDDDQGFITFIAKDSNFVLPDSKIDFTGVDLDLNFEITPDAKLKIIFNDQTGDEINATGSGNIAMKMDNLGELNLDGTYRIKDGIYNFAMGPIKQPFFVQEGGTITWTGDPYNANLDLKTYYKVNASIAEISPNEFQGTANVSDQEVLCYLNLTETLLKPSIGFNITSPKANETGRALLSRIVSDPDELNRQFFSLLLWRRFQPLKGTTATSSSGALDMVSNQINSILAMVSKDYKLNVNLDKDDISGENTMEFGVSKGFLDNRLVIKGNFGVETGSTNSQNHNQFIGDVSVEYLLNESGTFRVNIFNESNDNSATQDQGLFTQGAGLNYQEDFDNFENFLLGQYIVDIFRKKEQKKIIVKRKKRQTLVP
ncbi:MAG: translocation/assembly module TamB domain-containing protein [Bacteroidota bacterium]